MSRKLASIRKIKDIYPIIDADSLECAIVDGWRVVVKKDEFKISELVVYFEIDSWIPTVIAPFLVNKTAHVYKSIEGSRLKTIKLRGQISQGLIMPISILDGLNVTICEDLDVSSILNVIKWDPESDEMPSGNSKVSTWPFFMPKTDQQRIQNIKNIQDNVTWEVTEKLDGTSMTVYTYNGKQGVCSRNNDLVKTEMLDLYWLTTINCCVLDKLEEACKIMGKTNLAFQGEVIGGKIQGNRYNVTDNVFYLYDIYDIDLQQYVEPSIRQKVALSIGIKHVPIIDSHKSISGISISSILRDTEVKSTLNPKRDQEGYVYKCNTGQESFKVISNLFLLKE